MPRLPGGSTRSVSRRRLRCQNDDQFVTGLATCRPRRWGVFFGPESSFSLLVVLLSTLVIYGLVVYGGEEDQPA